MRVPLSVKSPSSAHALLLSHPHQYSTETEKIDAAPDVRQVQPAAAPDQAFNSMPWVEKYRPTSLQDLVAHEEIISIRKSAPGRRLRLGVSARGPVRSRASLPIKLISNVSLSPPGFTRPLWRHRGVHALSFCMFGWIPPTAPRPPSLSASFLPLIPSISFP